MSRTPDLGEDLENGYPPAVEMMARRIAAMPNLSELPPATNHWLGDIVKVNGDLFCLTGSGWMGMSSDT